ncbi:MAG: hypothetical protein HYY91_05995 [Candidatus Omnitrophica bacterium]|nr:hypothetical protein [Candidatus Omnitrophota bacterium]
MRVPRPLLIALLGLLGFAGVLAGTQPRSSAQQAEKTKAELAALDKKLKEVLATQQAILDKLNTVLEELKIVKVRCTVLR